jgi:4-alpha-glucanotransferase
MDKAEIANRRRHASEYLLDDERLTRELTDRQARVLLDWATFQALLVAANPAYAEQAFEDALATIRRAVRHVSRTHADEHDAARLISLVQEALAAETNSGQS